MTVSTRRPSWAKLLVAAAFAALLTRGSLAHAEVTNRIRAITFVEEGGATAVRIAGSQTATFTVYKLERPARVVIDLARAELSEDLRGHESQVALAANTWAVSSVIAQPLADAGNGVRVIVALARPGRYDVKLDGKDLLVQLVARDPAPAPTSSAEAARAKAAAEAAQRESQAARAEAAQLRNEKELVARTAEAAQRERERARQETEQARQDAERARQEAERKVSAAKASAEAAAREAARLRTQAAEQTERAQRAEQLASASQREARTSESARAEAERAQQEAARLRAQAETARRQAKEANEASLAAQSGAAKATEAAALAKAEAERARKDAERAKEAALAAKRQSEQELARARTELAAAKEQVAKDRVAIEQERERVSQREAALAIEAQRSRAAADKVRDEAEATRRQASATRAEAEAAQRAASAARAEADRLQSDAQATMASAQQKLADANAKVGAVNQRLAELDGQAEEARKLKSAAAKAQAAAAAREEAARRAVEQATATRQAAEAEVARLVSERDRATSQTRADRQRLAEEAKTAQARLDEVTRAAAAAEEQRQAAERAAGQAKAELERKRQALAQVEAQRQDSESKLREAAARQTTAEEAARRATTRQQRAESEAHTAETLRLTAQAAAQKAETQRLAAERAAQKAEEQRQAAELARQVAERDRQASEDGLAELSQRRREAERAAAAVESQRQAAETARQAAERVAHQRASAEEQRRARAEADKLAESRSRAEKELAERRARVAAQAQEVERLSAQAARARTEAEREENRRTQLAELRISEERELARLRQRAAESQAKASAAPVPAGKAPVVLASAPSSADKSTSKPAAAAAPAAPTAAAAPAAIADISFRSDGDEPVIELRLPPGAKVTSGPASDRRAELVIDEATLPSKLERKLDVSRYGGAVRSVSSFRDRKVPGRVHVVVELAAAASADLQRQGNVVGWRFTPQAVARRPRTQNLPPTVIGGFGAATTPVAQQAVTQVNPANRRRKVYRGPTVEMDFKDAPIHDLLRLLSDVGKVNIVVPDEVDAKVTVRMKRVPWDQALEVILASKGLWYRQEGNLIRVAQRKQLDEEDEAEAARRAAAVRAEAPRPDVLTLNYASAENLRNKLQPLLSPKGKIEVDDRTNALIVNDVRANREEVRALALQLDTQTPQISIEARIVEARSTYTRDIGVQWGGRAVAGPEGGNATGLLFPSSVALAGGAEDATTVRSGVPTPSDFAVNLPAAVGSGAGGALGLSLGSIGGNYNINLRLSALEGTGSVRIISAPKITVLNNTEAKISQGVSIPIQVLSANGTNTVFVPADLSLTVKPYVSLRDCAIAMDLNVTKNEPDFVNTGARGDPTILRKEARTTLLVNDGETSVLGGIYTRNAGLSYSKVPFFGDLPVLGWFFKNRKENDARTEVLVFITPKITNKAFLRCQSGPNGQ